MSTNETKEPEFMDQQDEVLEEQEQLSASDEAAVPEEGQPVEAAGGDNGRIAELERLAEENQSRFLRAQADFDNFRRRTLKEKEELAQYASMKLIEQMLPVLDNFERAIQSGAEAATADAFVKGVDMIYRQLFQVLEAEGLKAMEPVGQPFDPEMHQAIMQVASEEYEDGIVVEAVQTGYWMKDKVIRPAMVKVSG